MSERTILLCGLAALAAAGCGNKSNGTYEPTPVKKIEEAKLAPGQEATLFPWKVGNQWTYVLESVRQSQQGNVTDTPTELTYKLVEVTPVNGKTRAKFDILQNNNVVDKQVWELSDTGYFQISVSPDGVAFDPPQPAVMFPLEAGKTFKWTGTGVVPGNVKGTSTVESTVVGPQEVDTEMGRMSAIAVESQTQWTSGNLKGVTNSVAWWRPGYGIVRFKQTAMANNVLITQLLKLKSSTLK